MIFKPLDDHLDPNVIGRNECVFFIEIEVLLFTFFAFFLKEGLEEAECHQEGEAQGLMRGPGTHGLAHGKGRGGWGVGICVAAFGARAIFAGATIFAKTQIPTSQVRNAW